MLRTVIKGNLRAEDSRGIRAENVRGLSEKDKAVTFKTIKKEKSPHRTRYNWFRGE